MDDILAQTQFVERLHFFDGQRLFAEDLQGIEAFNRAMRWLHNQSLHQPGVGRGLAATGAKGATEVTIGPGYAIDAKGREIVLTHDLVTAVPPVAGETDGSSVFFDLAISYPDDASLPEVETREGICLPPGAVRLREEPVVCWVRLGRGASGELRPTLPALDLQIKGGLRIVLARAEVLNCQLRQPLSTAERHNARLERQAHVAAGELARPQWQVTYLPARALGAADLPLIGLAAGVDTSAGDFATVPTYMARIAGERVARDAAGSPQVALDYPVNIVEASPRHFRLSLLVGVQDSGSNAPSVAATTRRTGHKLIRTAPQLPELIKAWRIVWMGVE